MFNFDPRRPQVARRRAPVQPHDDAPAIAESASYCAVHRETVGQGSGCRRCLVPTRRLTQGT